jgi:hypothetical protein
MSYFNAVKRPKSDVVSSPPFSAKAIDAWSFTTTRSYALTPWRLIEHLSNTKHSTDKRHNIVPYMFTP